ncbi:anti-sigma factor [Deinococcus budaensis]|uniref:Regulator of SigK n=1 Tax=Deinococcus budaensis TaxID=1665626 RepID=A0A7W8LPF2_9DEIO|nr:anti-sigma factor [Deinococcus budaensis]MBB5233629.1 anti-sigma-K factor RskA [Deinococcus budaensis]
MKPDRDQLLAYALGQLPAAEAAQVEAALDADPALRADLRADLDALSLLAEDLDLGGVEVPLDAGARLLARVQAEEAAGPARIQPTPPPAAASSAPPPTPPAPRRPAWRLPAVLGLVAALALAFALFSRPDADPAARYAGQPGAVQRAIEVNGETLGTLVRLPDGGVYVRLTRPLPPGRTYQLWQLQGQTPVSLGTFGEGGLLVTLPAGATVAVSVEPPGGSPQPTTQPLFVQQI